MRTLSITSAKKNLIVRIFAAIMLSLFITGATAAVSQTSAYAATKYTVKYVAGKGGSIKGDTSQSVTSGGSTSSVTAVPSKGYDFVEWSDGSTKATRTDKKVAKSVTYTATFELQTFDIKYVAGTGGTIKGKSSQVIDYGKDGATVTATPNEGYRFVKWSDGSTKAARSETNVKDSDTITATFEALSYTIKYSAGAGGTVKGNLNQSVRYKNDGSLVTATPNVGYRFVRWSDGSTKAARTDLDVTESADVKAIFEVATFTLKYSAGAGGALKGTASQTISYNNDATMVTAVASTGYRFVKWSDNITSASRTDKDIKANLAVSAVFEQITFTAKYTAGNGGTLKGTASQTIGYGDDGTLVTAVPNAGYRFVKWSDNSTSASRTDLDVKANIAVTATFEAATYKVVFQVVGTHGELRGKASQVVAHGANASLVTAVADPGYAFVKWSDNVTTAARTLTNVKAAITLQATFAMTAAEKLAQSTALAAVVAYEKGTFAQYQAAFDLLDDVKDVDYADALQARIDAASAKYAESAVVAFEKGTIDNLKTANDFISVITDLTLQGEFQTRVQSRLSVLSVELVSTFAETLDLADFESAKLAVDQVTVQYVHDGLLVELDGALTALLNQMYQDLISQQSTDVVSFLAVVDLLSDTTSQDMFYKMVYAYLMP